MSNSNNPNGFTEAFTKSGYRGRRTRYWKDATAGKICLGDDVVRVASSSDPQGGPEIVRATVGSYVTGVVVGFDPIYTDLNRSGCLEASESGYVYVNDDPDQVYTVMEAGSGTALAVTDIGKHIDSITSVDGSSVKGRSLMAIDNNAKATDNTWIIVGKDPNTDVGPYCRWRVKANLSTEVNAGATNIKEI